MLPRNVQITFDDRRLVANAGLLLPATLARHLGCPNSSGSASTWAMPRGGRTRADDLVASALAGGDWTTPMCCAPGGRPAPWAAR